MDGAYFTSKNEILSFLNQLLDLNLTKIEQTASGCVACQLIEYIFPKSIPMSKVNWGAKSSHEYGMLFMYTCYIIFLIIYIDKTN